MMDTGTRNVIDNLNASLQEYTDAYHVALDNERLAKQQADFAKMAMDSARNQYIVALEMVLHAETKETPDV